MAGAAVVVLAAVVAVASLRPHPARRVEAAVAWAATCATCHGSDGVSAAAEVPSLAGFTADDLAARTNVYRLPAWSGTVMHHLVVGYSEAEVAAIARVVATSSAGGRR